MDKQNPKVHSYVLSSQLPYLLVLSFRCFNCRNEEKLTQLESGKVWERGTRIVAYLLNFERRRGQSFFKWTQRANSGESCRKENGELIIWKAFSYCYCSYFLLLEVRGLFLRDLGEIKTFIVDNKIREKKVEY